MTLVVLFHYLSSCSMDLRCACVLHWLALSHRWFTSMSSTCAHMCSPFVCTDIVRPCAGTGSHVSLGSVLIQIAFGAGRSL